MVVEYLTQNQQFSHQHLNGIKSAIVSVFRVLHSEKSPLAPHERVQQFFPGKEKNRPKTPQLYKGDVQSDTYNRHDKALETNEGS